MFKELSEAADSLDPAKPTFGNADLFYNGDVAKWKKFSYTLMLRLGMRLTKADPALAQTWVEKAIAGGVMTSFGDITKISYANVSGGMNPKIQNTYLNDNYLNPQDADNVEGGKYAATFIDKLKSTNDPRLPVISVVWAKPAGATAYVADTTPAIQKGMISGSLNTKPADFDTYSEPSTFLKSGRANSNYGTCRGLSSFGRSCFERLVHRRYCPGILGKCSKSGHGAVGFVACCSTKHKYYN